jgi:hypothetical protein
MAEDGFKAPTSRAGLRLSQFRYARFFRISHQAERSGTAVPVARTMPSHLSETFKTRDSTSGGPQVFSPLSALSLPVSGLPVSVISADVLHYFELLKSPFGDSLAGLLYEFGY